jgi:hypothetical protein
MIFQRLSVSVRATLGAGHSVYRTAHGAYVSGAMPFQKSYYVPDILICKPQSPVPAQQGEPDMQPRRTIVVKAVCVDLFPRFGHRLARFLVYHHGRPR